MLLHLGLPKAKEADPSIMSLSKLEKGSVEFTEDVSSDVSPGQSDVLVDSSGEIRRLPIPSKDPNDPLNFSFAAKLGIIVSCCWFCKWVP